MSNVLVIMGSPRTGENTTVITDIKELILEIVEVMKVNVY